MANLLETYLSGAGLRGVILRLAKMQDANLRGC
jgi:uncharacterized protein YjbI with pentapeptide repeats